MTEDLLSALSALRNDPAFSEILRSSGQAPSSANVRESQEIEVQDLNNSKAKAFLKQRNLDREMMGTTHWIQKHREELHKHDAQRLSNRLKAEHLFATAQIEFENFKQDVDSENSSPFREPSLEKPLGDKLSVPPSHVVDPYDTRRTSSKVEETPRRVGDVPKRSEEMPNDVFEGKCPTFEANRDPPTISSMHTGFTSPGRPKNEEKLDEGDNYHKKQEEFLAALEVTQRSPIVQRRTDSHDLITSQHRDEMLEALRQRDRTIQRLERTQREEREYFEATIRRMKDEYEQARRHSESKLALLQAQVDELSREGVLCATQAASDAERLVQQAHHHFLQHADVLRAESNALLRNYEGEVDSHIREVFSTVDVTLSNAREKFIVDKSDVITQEKTRLLKELAKEQDLLLRETEIELRDELTRSCVEAMKNELQRHVRDQTEIHGLPKLQSLVTEDVRQHFGATLSDEVTTILKSRMDDLHVAVRQEIAVGNAQLQSLAATLAAQTMTTSSALAAKQDLNKHMILFQELQSEAAKIAAEQREEMSSHTSDMRILRSKIEELNQQLETEKSVSKQLAAEVLKYQARYQNVLE